MTLPDMDEPQDQLVCVTPSRIDAIWPHVSLFIQTAYWTGLGDDTAESLKADLDRCKDLLNPPVLLWIVWDGKGIIAAAVTEIMDLPARKVGVVRALGGREIDRWKKFVADLEAYMKSQGCERARVLGRPGWKAVLSDYRQPWIALEKELR